MSNAAAATAFAALLKGPKRAREPEPPRAAPAAAKRQRLPPPPPPALVFDPSLTPRQGAAQACRLDFNFWMLDRRAVEPHNVRELAVRVATGAAAGANHGFVEFPTAPQRAVLCVAPGVAPAALRTQLHNNACPFLFKCSSVPTRHGALGDPLRTPVGLGFGAHGGDFPSRVRAVDVRDARAALLWRQAAPAYPAGAAAALPAARLLAECVCEFALKVGVLTHDRAVLEPSAAGAPSAALAAEVPDGAEVLAFGAFRVLHSGGSGSYALSRAGAGGLLELTLKWERGNYHKSTVVLKKASGGDADAGPVVFVGEGCSLDRDSPPSSAVMTLAAAWVLDQDGDDAAGGEGDGGDGGDVGDGGAADLDWESLVLSEAERDRVGIPTHSALGQPGYVCSDAWRHVSDPAPAAADEADEDGEVDDDGDEVVEDGAALDLGEEPEDVGVAAAAADAGPPLPFQPVVGLDCEMCYTSEGLEMTRLTVVDVEGAVLYDELCLTDAPITSHNTEYSGVDAEQLKGVTRTRADAVRELRERGVLCARTVVVGHSVESDLKAMRLVHARVVDTSCLYPHPRGGAYRISLRDLSRDLLGVEIQQGGGTTGHDSAVDAITAVKLAALKATRGPAYRTPKPFADAGAGGLPKETLVAPLARCGREGVAAHVVAVQSLSDAGGAADGPRPFDRPVWSRYADGYRREEDPAFAAELAADGRCGGAAGVALDTVRHRRVDAAVADAAAALAGAAPPALLYVELPCTDDGDVAERGEALGSMPALDAAVARIAAAAPPGTLVALVTQADVRRVRRLNDARQRAVWDKRQRSAQPQKDFIAKSKPYGLFPDDGNNLLDGWAFDACSGSTFFHLTE